MRFSARGLARRRRGFTLPEVIVTITLIGVLASVVVPTIISQVKKGDPARVGSDFMAVRGAIEQFLTDVRRGQHRSIAGARGWRHPRHDFQAACDGADPVPRFASS